MATLLQSAPPVIARATSAFERACAEWRQVLGADFVSCGGDANAAYRANTLGLDRSVPAVLRPGQAAEVQEVMRIAQRHRVPVYPISTGRNWGNGCALPTAPGTVLLDLGRLNRILHCDAELGVVTVEPGVTQGQLAAYLDARGLPFLVPTTGAGPDAGILGNVVERGYGLTPYGDHFGHVMSLEAILPDGTLYRGALDGSGGREVASLFKWGVGPYLDGLFTQSSLGVVTRVTLALAPRPECSEVYFIALRDETALEPAVQAVREVLGRLRGVAGQLNLMNRRRMLAMFEPYPGSRIAPGGVMSEALCEELAAPHGITAWTAAGALFGTREVVAAAKRELKRAFGPLARRWLFVSPRKAAFLRKAASLLPFVRRTKLPETLARLEAGVANMCGRPSTVALPLAYWRTGRPLPPDFAGRISQVGSGLIWYTPLVPMRPAAVRAYAQSVERICSAHGIEPLLTLTSLSDRCFDSTVPVLFDKTEPGAAERAQRCFRELFTANQAQGWVPYRGGLQSMDLLVQPEAPGWQLGQRIKDLLDPQNILAPGRYGAR